MEHPPCDADYLKRLPPEFYRGQACVHWSLTIEDRKTGWVVPVFHYRFRELLAHTMFRYGLCCPVFCLMPDHMHLLWVGILDSADQRVASSDEVLKVTAESRFANAKCVPAGTAVRSCVARRRTSTCGFAGRRGVYRSKSGAEAAGRCGRIPGVRILRLSGSRISRLEPVPARLLGLARPNLFETS